MITLHVVKRKNPKDVTKSAFYPSIALQTPVKRNSFYDDIANESTMTKHDLKAGVSALEAQLIKYLKEGYSVRLGDLGSFHVSVKSKKGGKATAADVSSADVKCLRVHFSKSARLRHEFNIAAPDIQFQGPKKPKP